MVPCLSLILRGNCILPGAQMRTSLYLGKALPAHLPKPVGWPTDQNVGSIMNGLKQRKAKEWGKQGLYL
jgi:hypothetical protein